MSVRSLWGWEQAAAQEPVGLGRPPHSPAARAHAQDEVAIASGLLGHTAGRWTLAAVVAMPRRLLEPALRAVKASHRAHVRQKRAAHRVHAVVHATGALVAQDSTYTGSSGRRKVCAEVRHDRATLASRASGTGRPVTAEEVSTMLWTWAATDQLPLVWSTDNGAAYRAKEVEQRCLDLQVIHLRSRRHTPQDNAGVERSIGEGKAEAGLGRGVMLHDAAEGVASLAAAFTRLNARPRATRGGLSANELTALLPTWEAFVSRAEFFNAARGAIQRAVPEGINARARRHAEREAIVQTLEGFGLLSRMRGGRPFRAVKPEMIS